MLKYLLYLLKNKKKEWMKEGRNAKKNKYKEKIQRKIHKEKEYVKLKIGIFETKTMKTHLNYDLSTPISMLQALFSLSFSSTYLSWELQATKDLMYLLSLAAIKLFNVVFHLVARLLYRKRGWTDDQCSQACFLFVCMQSTHDSMVPLSPQHQHKPSTWFQVLHRKT